MIDFGLLVSFILAFGLPALLSNWWRVAGQEEPVGFLDVAVGPAVAGLVVGRLTTLGLDDPNSLGSVSDMLVIRSGVEFWPGVIAALVTAAMSAKRSHVPIGRRLTDLTPLAMVGYAGYEAACIFRDGCFGPSSPVGLRPPGIATTMLPVGWFMAATIAVAAVGVHVLAVRRHSAPVVVTSAVLAVAVVRAIGSIWLPHVGDGLTRQHLTSIVVAGAAGFALLFSTALARRVGSREQQDPTMGRQVQ